MQAEFSSNYIPLKSKDYTSGLLHFKV